MATERDILERLRRRAGSPSTGLVLGIGDDCAIYHPARGEELVFTTDLFLENVHFRRATHTPREIGYHALARGLSDLAAMGAAPRFCLFSLAAADWANSRVIDSILDGLLALAKSAGCPLAGGDLSRLHGSADPLLCDIVACGSVPTGKAFRRAGAKPGDSIWVSGKLGGSALGLRTQTGPARRRHLRPEPRLALGVALRGKATAALDVSDGLSIDLARLCAASGVAAQIVMPPIFPGATAEDALHGGEDYELLFTARARTRFPAVVAGVSVTRIGQIEPGPAGEVFLNGEALAALGYDHFRRRS